MSSHTPASTVFLALERQSHDLLQALSAAIYVTDAAGRITFYNEAAAKFWGQHPELGKTEFCGSWKLFWPDGTPMAHDQCPLAVVLKNGHPNRGIEAIAEREDGTRVSFLAFPTPLFDEAGNLTGAVSMLVDITDYRCTDLDARRLAAIVESSDDAIIATDFTGVITNWNQGAERLFGYTANEVVGKSIMILIPAERHDEEPAILARIRRGECVDHYETIRRRKDGSLVEISLTVSPIKSSDGRITGASKIARDITEQRRAQEKQQLLLREMDHRVKNLFALAASLVNLSARSAATAGEVASDVGARLVALARAHELTVSRVRSFGTAEPTMLHALIATIITPYEDQALSGRGRVAITGVDVPVTGDVVTSIALLLYEFATNAAKYGALSTPSGRVDIECAEKDGEFILTWVERGVAQVEQPDFSEGFGGRLERATVKGQLGGDIVREWNPDGLIIRLSLPLTNLTG